MKKFFKALALVLALTLVVGTIPASAAEYEFSLKKEKKIIYLGGASGEKEVDGETIKCGTKSRYKVSKLVNGFDPETMDIQLESSDKSIVKTSNAKDKVYAKAIGTADVTIYVIDKETEKQLKDLTLKVQVKKNAAAVTAIITDAEGNPADLTASKAGVNVPYIVTLPRKDADGNFVDTDYRTLTASDESVQIEAANKYGTQYKVTFTKAGTFALTAASYQSKIWNKLQNVVTVPVKAGYDAVAVEQSALDTVKVTFDTPVAGLEKANFNAYYKINDVVIPYSDVATDGISYDAADKNVAYVKFLSDFIANTEFFVQYDGKDAGSFTAANPTVDSVKTVLIPTQKIDAGVESNLQFKLLNEQGIDITKAVLANGGVVSFEIVNDDFKNYVTTEKVYITNANDSITVKGTYTYWDKDSNQKTVTGEGQIVAVAPAVWTIGSLTGMISDKALVTDQFALNGDAKPATWTLDNPEIELQSAVPYTKNGKTLYEGFDKDNADIAVYTGYSAKVADETIALITSKVAGQNIKLKANKAGSTTVLIYGIKDDGSEVVIGAVPVTVKDNRKIGSWTVTASKTNLNLSFDDDTVSFEIVVKDQDGQDYYKDVAVGVVDDTSSKTEVKDKDGVVLKFKSTTADKSTTAAGPKVTVSIKASELQGVGTHNIKFTVNNESKMVRLACGNDGEAVRYLLKLSEKELKTGIKLDTKNDKTATIGLEGLSKTGSAASASGVSIKFIKYQPKASAATGYTGDKGFVYTITKDGKLMDTDPKTLVGNNLTAFATGKNASTSAVKLDKGTYVITAYEIKLNAAGTSYVPNPVGSPQTLTVTDDQAAVEVKKNGDAEKLSALTVDTVGAAFDITFNGANVKTTDGLSYSFEDDAEHGKLVNVDESGKTAYVKGVNVTIANDNTGSWTIYVPIDTLVKKAQ